MNPIKLSIVIGEDRKLVIDLPPDVPTGAAELTIIPQQESEVLDLQTARARLLAADSLTIHDEPVGARRLTVEELRIYGQLAAGAKPTKELIDEEREARW